MRRRTGMILCMIIGSYFVYCGQHMTNEPPLGHGDGFVPGDPGDGMVGDARADPGACACQVSGGRLKAKFAVGEDGSKQFLKFHDTQRNEDCQFTSLNDGTLRCIPPAMPSYKLGRGSFVTFWADANCTVPVLYFPKGTCITSKYFMGEAQSGCTVPMQQILQVGNPLVTPNGIYDGANGGCTPASPNFATYDLYSATIVSFASFVGSQTVTDP